jgi:hypothetical protein
MKRRLISMILVLLFSLSSCASFEQPTAETSGEQSVSATATSVSAEEPGASAAASSVLSEEIQSPAEESVTSTDGSDTPPEKSEPLNAGPESTPESSESGQSSAPVITREEYESFGVTVQGAEKKARGFRDFDETMHSDFAGTWYDPELGEAIRLTETEAFVYIPYLDLYGDTGYPWRLVDRSEEGKCPKLSIDCFDNGASLAYYVAGNTGEYFWCVSQGQLFYRQD